MGRDPVVRDVMRTELQMIGGLETVAEAISAMRRAGVGALVVERRDAGDEYGIVTAHDIARRVLAPKRAPERVSVYEVMTKPVLTVAPGMKLRFAIRLLDRLDCARALVTGPDGLEGLVTLREMVLHPAGGPETGQAPAD